MEPVAVVVLDGEELPISICLTQHRLAHQIGSSILHPRQHIWSFANALDEAGLGNDRSRYTDSSWPNDTPSFVGSDYFCETGVPPGQSWSSGTLIGFTRPCISCTPINVM